MCFGFAGESLDHGITGVLLEITRDGFVVLNAIAEKFSDDMLRVGSDDIYLSTVGGVLHAFDGGEDIGEVTTLEEVTAHARLEELEDLPWWVECDDEEDEE